MFAQALAKRLSRAGIHYGWAIVAIIFFLALTTAGCMGISGALIVRKGGRGGRRWIVWGGSAGRYGWALWLNPLVSRGGGQVRFVGGRSRGGGSGRYCGGGGGRLVVVLFLVKGRRA